jgi:SAM-dependent methyltransferase
LTPALREHWDAQAEAWTRFVRDPAGDRTNHLFNLPAFLELVPAAGRRTLDLGCGEGRLSRTLAELGHRVVGVDSSAAMVAAAGDSRVDAVVGDAEALPFEDGAFDLAGAFMSLQDMDDPAAAVRETARVLEPGGRFCFCNLHPFASAGRFESREPGAAFVVAGSYFDVERLGEVVERDGHRIELSYVRRPLEAWVRMLEDAGLLVEAVREPPAPPVRESWLRWARMPLFLHVRAVKP